MKLLDYLIKNHGYKHDRAIAEGTGISTATISKIRTGKRYPSAEIMIILHERFGLPISTIRELSDENLPRNS